MPSALAGLLAVWSIYRLGTKIKDTQLGLLSGWMLLTTFYFVFWARTSSADMLNLVGTLFAVSWYFEKRAQPRFFNYAVFFMILALTSLCKGLVGAIVPLIAVVIDIVLQKSWRRHLCWSFVLGMIPALIVYLIPFWASSHFGGETYGQSGLYLVYRENILRYFQPFDHQGPVYTYFVFLPIYLLPWTLFFIPALVALKQRWRSLNADTRWLAWTLLCVFLFFTISGSRRSYYVLPLVPFALLFTADWIMSKSKTAVQCWTAWLVIVSYLFLFVALDAAPSWYYAHCGVQPFAVLLKSEAEKEKPWNAWHVVMLDAESKLIFYLHLPPTTKNYGNHVNREGQNQNSESLARAWPILHNQPADTIFITRKSYVPALRGFFPGYQLVEMQSDCHIPFMINRDVNAPVAFIPVTKK